MLNYLHDIRNKLTIISGHATFLARKYDNHKDFLPIISNVSRINELINEAYVSMSEHNNPQLQKLSFNEFLKQIDLLLESLALNYSIEINNGINAFSGPVHENRRIELSMDPLISVIENAVDNAFKASATKLIFHVIQVDENAILEIIDNGIGINLTPTKSQLLLKENTLIPHGLGKNIMMENMKKLNGKISWAPRTDSSGMIVRLTFPMTV